MTHLTKVYADKVYDKLRLEITVHNYLYHVMDDPMIDDHTYDVKYKELQTIEDKYPSIINPNSPTQYCGTPSKSAIAEILKLYV